MAGWKNFCFVTTWSHAAQRRLVRRSRRNTLRRSLITHCSSSRSVPLLTIHTSMLPTRQPSTWITRAVENKGVQEVPVKTSGHDKLHVTVMLTAQSEGFKCRTSYSRTSDQLRRSSPSSRIPSIFAGPAAPSSTTT